MWKYEKQIFDWKMNIGISLLKSSLRVILIAYKRSSFNVVTLLTGAPIDILHSKGIQLCFDVSGCGIKFFHGSPFYYGNYI